MRRYCQRGTSCRVEGNDSCDDGLFYKEACITSNDCRRMHFAWCVNGSCSLKKCSFRSDCVVGCVRRYCCTISYSDTKACSLYRCDGGKRFGRYAFGHNDSCFRGDINNDHSRCCACSYMCKRCISTSQNRGVRVSHGRAQDSRSVSANDLDQATTVEMQEQVYYPLSPDANNESIEMESWIELLENDGDESSTAPPCYTPNDPLASAGDPLDSDVTDNANYVNNAPSIPPPPYTSNDQLSSSDNEMNYQ